MFTLPNTETDRSSYCTDNNTNSYWVLCTCYRYLSRSRSCFRAVWIHHKAHCFNKLGTYESRIVSFIALRGQVLLLKLFREHPTVYRQPLRSLFHFLWRWEHYRKLEQVEGRTWNESNNIQFTKFWWIWGIRCAQGGGGGSSQARESTLALKPRADVTRNPKQGYQWPHKKDLCPSNIFKKIRKKNSDK